MSKAYEQFEYGIKDAEVLLKLVDQFNSKPPVQNSEVLKKAGLVLALTAWETYVEDRVIEEMDKKLSVVAGSYVGEFVKKKLQHELKSFHNPNPERTQKLFREFLEIEIAPAWSWANTDPEKAKTSLNSWLAKRGDAVHRSKPVANGANAPHLIKRDELEKVIRFVKELVKSTEVYLTKNL